MFQLIDEIARCKNDSLKMEDVYEDVIQHLAKNVKFTEWNVATAAVKYVATEYECPMDDSSGNTQFAATDQFYVNILLMLFNSHQQAEKIFNWATNSIGTWITKNTLMDFCPNINVSEYQTKINNFMTMTGESISLLDISQLFSINDVKALTDELTVVHNIHDKGYVNTKV